MSESESWLQYQQLIISFLERQDEKLEDLGKQIASNNGDRRALSENIAVMKEDIFVLKKIIRDGSDHSPSILNRLTTLETGLKSIIEAHQGREEEEKADLGHRRALFLVLIGFAGSVLWNIVQYFWM